MFQSHKGATSLFFCLATRLRGELWGDDHWPLLRAEFAKGMAHLRRTSTDNLHQLPRGASLPTPTIQECVSLYPTGDFNGFTSGLAKLTEREMLIQDKIASWRGLEAYLTTDEMSRVSTSGHQQAPAEPVQVPQQAAVGQLHLRGSKNTRGKNHRWGEISQKMKQSNVLVLEDR